MSESLDPTTFGAWLALMSLPSMGPRRLWDVAALGDPTSEWERLRSGAAPTAFESVAEQRSSWRAAAEALDAPALVAAHSALGIVATVHGDVAHPSLEVHDPHVPPVLLWRGSVSPPVAAARPTVGIIGTRRASRYGIELAREFGHELAARGCGVVSGLALGIDAAAHRGALEVGVPPNESGGVRVLGVVGSGLDVVYPKGNRSLWADVTAQGVICSEYPLGTPPTAWRFPARNRILVAMCDAIVVIESHAKGGSLITAGIAGARGVPVLAVPGAIRSAGSVGTNRLIADGCQPCLGIDDVLDAIGWSSAPTLSLAGPAGAGALTGATHSAAAVTLLDELGWSPRTVDELADACPSLSLTDMSVALAELLNHGIVVETDGRLERVR